MSLRLIFSPPAPGDENMAVDLALLRSVGQRRADPALRLYRWDGPWISFGHSQQLEGAFDRAVAVRAGCRCVRRPTGGKALLHGRDLTYSLVLPMDHRLARGTVVESHRAIASLLADALALLDIEPELTEGDPGQDPAVLSCMEEPRPETISVDGRKLIGSAQTRRDGGLLQHGMIPLEPDGDLLADLFRCPGVARDLRIEQVRSRMTSLSEAAPGVELPQLAAALIAAFSRALGPARHEPLSPQEITDAREIQAGIEVPDLG